MLKPVISKGHQVSSVDDQVVEVTRNGQPHMLIAKGQAAGRPVFRIVTVPEYVVRIDESVRTWDELLYSLFPQGCDIDTLSFGGEDATDRFFGHIPNVAGLV